MGRRGRRPVRRLNLISRNLAGGFRTRPYDFLNRFSEIRREGIGRGTVRVPLPIQSFAAKRRADVVIGPYRRGVRNMLGIRWAAVAAAHTAFGGRFSGIRRTGGFRTRPYGFLNRFSGIRRGI